MKFFRLLCLLPTLVILLATCKEAGSPTDANGNPTGNVTTTLAGIVVDESGQPVPGAAIIANSKNAVTDKYGTFMIQNAVVPGTRCFIICKKNGYFTGSRAEVPKSGGITELRLTLQSNSPGYTVNSSTGGTVTIGTASVKFPPSAFVTSDGKAFTGAVKVAAKHLDPSQPSFYNSFSGDMTARRTDGTQTELLSYGVLRVRLTDDAGNELKLAAGKTATLTYPIAPSQQKTAPASMPLWYFDEALGMWKEEGVAVKSGDFYTGEVSHFTDWNCDVPAKTGIVKGRVMCNNDGVAGIYVTVGQRKAITDSSGYFTCRVAANTDFTISINATENGGFTAPDVLVPAVSAGEERVVTLQLTTCPAYISGVIVDCNDNPVAGTVVVTYSGLNTFHFTTAGSFKMRVPVGVDLTVEAISYNGFLSLKQSIGSITFGDKKEIGRLSTCGNGTSAEFIDIAIGASYAYVPVISRDGSMIAINGKRDKQGYFTEVYETKTGNILCQFTRKDNNIKAINFSDDGTKLFIHFYPDSAYVVNPVTGSIIQKFSHLFRSWMLPDGSAIIAVKDFGNYNSLSKFSMYSISDGLLIKDLPFKDVGEYDLVGTYQSSQLVLLNRYYMQNSSKIIRWDIVTEEKVSEIITTPCVSDFDGSGFSQDFSTISLIDGSKIGMLNFYNTLTGEKINSIPFLSPGDRTQHHRGPKVVANNLTFVIQGYGINGQPMLPPATYTVPEGKLQKVLPMPSYAPVYVSFKYSADNQFLAGVEAEFKSVRVWKLNHISFQ